MKMPAAPRDCKGLLGHPQGGPKPPSEGPGSAVWGFVSLVEAVERAIGGPLTLACASALLEYEPARYIEGLYRGNFGPADRLPPSEQAKSASRVVNFDSGGSSGPKFAPNRPQMQKTTSQMT